MVVSAGCMDGDTSWLVDDEESSLFVVKNNLHRRRSDRWFVSVNDVLDAIPVSDDRIRFGGPTIYRSHSGFESVFIVFHRSISEFGGYDF